MARLEMHIHSITAPQWYLGFSNSTGQPQGDKIILSRVSPHFIRLEIEAPGVCSQPAAWRNSHAQRCILEALSALQEHAYPSEPSSMGNVAQEIRAEIQGVKLNPTLAGRH